MKLILENWNNFVNEEEELEEAIRTTAKGIYVEKLPNGFYRFHDNRSQLSGLYSRDGTRQGGDLHLNKNFVQTKIAELTK